MKPSGKKLFIVALILGLELTMAAAVIAQELKMVRFGYPSLGFRQGHIWVAKDEGFFKKYGLEKEGFFNEMAKRYPAK